MDAKQKERIQKAIVQTHDGFYEAARQCDVRSFMSYFIDSDEMTVTENEEIRPSRKVFEEWVTGFYKDVVKLDVTVEERRVFPLSLDVAVATGVFRYSAQATSGEVVGGRVAFTFVFVKKGERWLISNVHESSIPAEAEA